MAEEFLSDADVGIGPPALSDKDVGIEPSSPLDEYKTRPLWDIGASAKDVLGIGTGSFTDVQPETVQAAKESAKSAATSFMDIFNPYSEYNKAKAQEYKTRSPWDIGASASDVLQAGKKIGSAALSAVGVPGAIISGPAGSILGHAQTAVTPGLSYEKAREQANLAMLGMTPARGGLGSMVRPVTAPPPPETGPFGVTLSEGRKTGDIAAIQREKAALNAPPETAQFQHAKEFEDQLATQLEESKGVAAKQLNPSGQQIVESPQEAGQLVSEGIRREAAKAKTNVDLAYATAREHPGEIHAGVFEGMPQKIRGDLTLGDNPVIIDKGTTPFASQAMDYLENRIGNLNIQNKADPFGPPNPENIVGVNLEGVDQMRKNLSSFRRDAYKSGTDTDRRAMHRVIDSFDNQIDYAVNNGLFTGDKSAIKAWNNARAAHSDYKSTFAGAPGDSVGKVVEKIIGKGVNDPEIPSKVVDHMYGAIGINPTTQNVGVAKRIKSILGEDSAEWIGAKQGLFYRVVDPGEGMTAWKPDRVADRINKFLHGNGKEVANVFLSQPERQMWQEYADLMRKIAYPPTPSRSTFVNTIMSRIGYKMSWLIGAAMGHAVAPGLPWAAGEIAGAATTAGIAKFRQAAQARQISKQMPLVADTMLKWQRAADAAQKANTPISQRALGVAGTNLGNALSRMGISPEILSQGTVPVGAQENQQP